VVISWAASVFIVGCTAAASASLLVETDESIMAKYLQVRWTVRVLTLVSAIHVFIGVMLMGAAIGMLDPNASAPFSGKQEVSRHAVKVAGGYAVGMAIVSVITMITVRRRHTYRTWFA
jgi:nitrate reductase gamma subunit